MPRVPPKIKLNEGQIADLKALARGEGDSMQFSEEQATRAKIILMAHEGMSNKAIADSINIRDSTVAKWRNRYSVEGIEGLKDASGRKGRVPALNSDIQLKISQILNVNPGMSRRAIQKEIEDSCGVKVSYTTIQRVLDKTGLRTNPQESWAKNKKLEFVPKVSILLGLSQHGDQAALFIGMREVPISPMDSEFKGLQQYDDNQSLLIAQLVSRDLNTEISDKQQEAGAMVKDIKYAMSLNPDQRLCVILYATNETVVKWLDKQEAQLEFHSASSFDTWLEMVEMQLKMFSRKGLTHNVLGSKAEVVRKIKENIQEIKSERRVFGWWFNRGIKKL